MITTELPNWVPSSFVKLKLEGQKNITEKLQNWCHYSHWTWTTCAVALLTVPQSPTAHKLRGNVPQWTAVIWFSQEATRSEINPTPEEKLSLVAQMWPRAILKTLQRQQRTLKLTEMASVGSTLATLGSSTLMAALKLLVRSYLTMNLWTVPSLRCVTSVLYEDWM